MRLDDLVEAKGPADLNAQFSVGNLLGERIQRREQLVNQRTLMTVGFYNEPAGAYLPSILY
jgi:hypothetical protein